MPVVVDASAIAAIAFGECSRPLRLRIGRISVPAPDAFRLARETGLTTYDASYLWLALVHDAELVTLDGVLAKAADEGRRSRRAPR